MFNYFSLIEAVGHNKTDVCDRKCTLCNKVKFWTLCDQIIQTRFREIDWLITSLYIPYSRGRPIQSSGSSAAGNYVVLKIGVKTFRKILESPSIAILVKLTKMTSEHFPKLSEDILTILET